MIFYPAETPAGFAVQHLDSLPGTGCQHPYTGFSIFWRNVLILNAEIDGCEDAYPIRIPHRAK
jgi:hypothetical protein